MQLTKLKNSLALCSKDLQTRVTKRGLLGKNKQPISVAELCKLAMAAGLGAPVVRTLDVVDASSE